MPGRTAGQRRGMPAGRDPVAGRLGHGQADGRLADEPVKQADRVRAAPDTGQDEIRQSPLDGQDLGRRLVAQDPLEVAHDRRVGVRAHRRAEDIVGGLDVRDPVAHRLVDGVLERGRAGSNRPDLGAQGSHPEDVGLLALDVLGAHEHDTGQIEQGAGRRRRDPVLARAGLGDHPGLAQPPGQEGLAEGVVDLVGAGVAEVLALQVQPQAGRDRRPGGAGRSDEPARFVEGRGGQPIGAIERGRPARIGRQQGPELGPEAGIVAELVVRPLEVLEGRHQGLRHVPTAEFAVAAPATGRVGLEQAGERPAWVGRRRLGRSQRAARARLAKRATRSGSLCGRCPSIRAASTPEATSTPIAATERTASPTLAGLSPPPRITGTARAIAAARLVDERVPVPPGWGPPAVSRRIALRAGVEVGLGAGNGGGGQRLEISRRDLGREVECTSRPAVRADR